MPKQKTDKETEKFMAARKRNKIKAKFLGLSEVQRLNLRLMELASFNSFNGPKVVNDLLNNLDLWDACLMDREAIGIPINLIKLRDMSSETRERLGQDCWNVDTLYILPKSLKSKHKLENLVRQWNPDEVYWIPNDISLNLLGGFPEPRAKEIQILRVWWD